MHLSVCPLLRLSVHSFILPSVHPSTIYPCLSLYLLVHRFIYSCIYSSVCDCPSMHPGIYPSVSLSIHPFFHPYIHQPIIYTTSPTRVTGMLKPILADFGREMGYTLGRLPIYHWANTETNNHSTIGVAS